MTNQILNEEISMLFCSEKFSGWWVVVGDIAIIKLELAKYYKDSEMTAFISERSRNSK